MSRLPFAMRGIDHVVLRVRDLERSLGFYVGVLGCVPTWRREALGLVHLRAGAVTMIDLVSLDVHGTVTERLDAEVTSDPTEDMDDEDQIAGPIAIAMDLADTDNPPLIADAPATP